MTAGSWARGRVIPFVVMLLAASCLSSCGAHTTSIKNLLDDPTRYDGSSVRVAGKVTENLGVMGYGIYRLDDGTGTIAVISEKGGAPREGAKVTVDGKFRSAFTVGDFSAAVIQESARKSR